VHSGIDTLGVLTQYRASELWMDEGRRERKNASSGKMRNPKYQEQYDYATNCSGSAKGQSFKSGM